MTRKPPDAHGRIPPPAPESADALAAEWFRGPDAIHAAAALRTLEEPGKPPPVRIWRACLKLSKGHLKDLHHYVEQARLDFRDVLYWAESYGQ